MKYLSVIYYDTFARFFCAIEDAVKAVDSHAEFLHLAIFPSGYLYLKVRGRNVRLVPWSVRESKADAYGYTTDELDRISLYHSVTGARHGIEYKEKLRERAKKYINVMSSILEEFSPDTIIFSGDTRIACESLMYCLDKSGSTARRFFFEQGPNGTTIFDTQGVNANCSFRKEAGSLTGEGCLPTAGARPEQFRRNPIYRGTDYLITYLLRLLGKLPPEWDSMSLRKTDRDVYLAGFQKPHQAASRRTSEILVALQVPDDANNIHHNPLSLGDAELVKLVLQATSDSPAIIRVREHPLYRCRYSDALYEMAASNPRVFLSSTPLIDDLLCASVVVTVNSMTGLDGYLRNIPIITMGNSFYDHLPGIERAYDVDSLGQAIVRVGGTDLSQRLGGRDPATIFSEMREKYFIPGHYRDRVLVAQDTIARILTRTMITE